MAPRLAGFAKFRWGSWDTRSFDGKNESGPGIVSELKDPVLVSLKRSGNSDISPLLDLLLESDIDDHEFPSGEPGSKATGSGSGAFAGYG